MANVKAHLMAAAVMVPVVFFGATFLIEKQQSGQSVATTPVKENPYFIQVYEATYGDNCRGRTEYKAPDKNGVREAVKVEVKTNNRLRMVSDYCNTKSTCSFTVSRNVLKEAGTYDCKPGLKVRYRCFTVDRLQTLRVRDEEEMVLNCEQKAVEERLAGYAKQRSKKTQQEEGLQQ